MLTFYYTMYRILQTFFLCFVPHCIHFLQRHVSEIPPLFDGMLLQIVETPDKFLIGMFQCIIGVNLI